MGLRICAPLWLKQVIVLIFFSLLLVSFLPKTVQAASDEILGLWERSGQGTAPSMIHAFVPFENQ